ncbi:MAG: hypothetical protein AB9869_36490 [Verrucomicrobiia bacterium]
MKKQLLKPTLVLATAAAATLFTGCASMQPGGYSSAHEPVNTLAFVAPTDPHQLVSWTGSRYLFLPMQSQDLYYFRVPDTGYEPGRTTVFGGSRYDTDFDRNDARGTTRAGDSYEEDYGTGTGMGAPGTFGTGSGSGGTKVIRHQPGGVR